MLRKPNRDYLKIVTDGPSYVDCKMIIVCDHFMIHNRTYRRTLYQMVRNSTGKRCRMSNKDVTRWKDQGVLIWDLGKRRPRETVTLLSILKNSKPKFVFLLWGRRAWDYERLLAIPKHHLVLKAHRPSRFTYKPYFKDCNHFKMAEQFLDIEIDWTL